MSVVNTDLCTGWDFVAEDLPMDASRFQSPDSAIWHRVHVPHTWNAEDMAPGEPHKDAYVGPGWYRKRFRVEPRTRQNRFFLLFEGVALHSAVWVDGAFVGGRDGGFLSFRLEITDFMRPDGNDHEVRVRVDNRHRRDYPPPAMIDWERYGGIFRPVWLLQKGPAAFDHASIRVNIRSASRQSAVVGIEGWISDIATTPRNVTVRSCLRDPDGTALATLDHPVTTCPDRSVPFRLTLPTIPSPRLWHPDSPQLYRIELSLRDRQGVLDLETHPLGIRWCHFDSEHGFILNDRPMKLCGVNAHQDFPGLGNACPKRFHRREIELMKEAGINFLRASHYPRHREILDACDELGILVLEEQPYWHGSLRAEGGEALITNARKLVREMVERHANHPCIIGWNTVNEIMLKPCTGEPHPDPRERKRRHTLPAEERPFACRAIRVINDELHRADPRRPTSVILGGKWRENCAAGVPHLADVIGCNGGVVNQLVENRPVYDILRERYPGRAFLMTEGVLNDRPVQRADWAEETVYWTICATHWSRFYRRPWFSGGSMWAFADYSANGTYRNMAMMDYSRLPYESYYFFQAIWRDSPVVHICGHWEPDLHPEALRCVTVFSNCPTVELFLNGVSMGRHEPGGDDWPDLPHPPFSWRVKWEPGALEAVGYASNGDEIRDARVTSGTPCRIEPETDDNPIVGDGRDIAFITVVITDAGGNRCYCCDCDLDVAVEGDARLTGPARKQVRGGIGRFAVRTLDEPGVAKVTVRTNDDFTAEGSLTVNVAPRPEPRQAVAGCTAEIERVHTEDHVQRVAGLARTIWTEHYVPIIGRAQVEYMLTEFQSVDAINEQIRDGCLYYLLVMDGNDAGYVAARPDTGDASMFLSKLYVHRKYRGRGIAHEAVAFLEQLCRERDLSTLWLTANKNNRASIAAYRRLGFVKTKSVVQDIGHGFVMDDFQFEKRIL